MGNRGRNQPIKFSCDNRHSLDWITDRLNVQIILPENGILSVKIGE